MKADKSEVWRQRGKRFEIFKPKRESVRPSEWLVPLYAVSRFVRLAWITRSEKGTESASKAQTNRRTRKAGWWFGKSLSTQELEREEEGWVL